MAETVAFPDAVALVLDLLSERLPAVPTGTLVPSPRPPRFVLARRAGGQRTAVVLDTAIVTVEAWADDPAGAADLAEAARAAVHSLEGTVRAGTPVYRVDDVGAPGDLPDPLSNQPRYTFSVLLTLRGTTINSS